ncbi:MAG: hypothetical protein ACI9FZ_000974, partial [Bacteroidia bacterium]
DDDKRMLAFLVGKINETYRFKPMPALSPETTG